MGSVMSIMLTWSMKMPRTIRINNITMTRALAESPLCAIMLTIPFVEPDNDNTRDKQARFERGELIDATFSVEPKWLSQLCLENFASSG